MYIKIVHVIILMTIKLEDFNIYNISINEKLHTNFFLTFNIKIRFDKVDGFIRIYNGIRCLTVFGPDAINNIIRYLVSLKSSITCFFSLLCKNQS